MGQSKVWLAAASALFALAVGCKGVELPAQSQFVGVAGADATAAVDGGDAGADSGTDAATTDSDADAAEVAAVDVATDAEIGADDVEVASTDAEVDAMDVADASTDAEVAATDVVDASTDAQVDVSDAVDAATDAEDAGNDAVDASADGDVVADDLVDAAVDSAVDSAGDATAIEDVAADGASDATALVDATLDTASETADAADAATAVDAGLDVSACVDPCANDLPCMVNFKCQAGKCVGTAKNCDDANVCTDDSCNAVTGCQHANNLAVCNDGQSCTDADKCAGGKCAGTPKNCDDGNACTDDSCDLLNGCANVPNTKACEDGEACNGVDLCQGGKCIGGSPNSWFTAAGDAQHEEFYGVAAAPGGGAWAVGFRENLSAAWLVRTDSAGKVILDKPIDVAGEQVLRSVAAEATGGAAAVGYTGGDANWDAWFLRLDAQGSILAQKTIDGPKMSQFYDLAVAGTGYYAVGSTAEGATGGLDAWVVRLDGVGNLTWQRTFGSGIDDYGTSVLARPDGGLVAVGTVAKPVGPPVLDHWMVWQNAAGDVERQLYLGAPAAGRLDGIAAAPEVGSLPAGYFVVGARGQTLNLTDGWVARVSATGTILWDAAIAATAGHDICYGVVATPDGGCMATCSTGFGPTTGGAVAVVRVDASGNVQWQRSTNTAGSLHTFSNAEAVLDGTGALQGVLFGGQLAIGGGTSQAVVARTDLWGYTGCSGSGKCATVPHAKCDDAKPCTADDCLPADGACKHTNHTGTCDAKGCTVGDACFAGDCAAGAKAKLWEKVYDPGAGELFGRRLMAPISGDRVIGAFQGNSAAVNRIIAYGLDGSELWNVFKPTASDGKSIAIKDIAQLHDGRVAIVGGSSTPSAYTLLFDVNGKNLADIAGPAGNVVEALCASPNGGWWIAGYTTGNGAGVLQFYGADGKLLIDKTYGGSGKERLDGVACLPGGGAVAAGWSDSGSVGGTDAWLLWVDAAGKVVGEALVGGTKNDECQDVVALADGTAACAGFTASKGAGPMDGLVLRAAPNGAVVWQGSYGGPGHDGLYDLVAVAGGFVAAGVKFQGPVYDQNADGQAWVLRLDGNGNKVNESVWGGPDLDFASSIVALPGSSDLVVVGARGSGTNLDAWTARIDPWGAPTCAASGNCAAKSAASCLDTDPCTLDTCDAVKGCVHAPAAEFTVCASGKVCQKGACVAGAPPKCLVASDCEDQNACTDDICDPANGCSNVPNGKACDDSDACTHDACANGKCVGSPAWSYYTGGAGPGADQMYGVAATIDNGWVAVGTRNDAKQGWVVRFGPDGKVVWDKGLSPSSGQRQFSAVLPQADGTFTAFGYSYFGGSAFDGLVTRIAADGNEISSVDHKGVGLDQFFSAVAVPAGSIAVGGTGPSNGEGQDGWVLGLDKQGNKLWEKTSGLAKEDRFWGITAAGADEVLAVGNVVGADGNFQGRAVWYDAAGNAVRERRYGSSAIRNLTSAAAVPAGAGLPAGYVLAGTLGDQGANTDGWVVRIDTSGALLWQKTLATTPKGDHLAGVAAWEGGLAVAGYRNNSDTDNFGAATWLARLDLLGNLQWERSVTDNGNLHTFSNLLAQPSSHPAGAGLVVAGQFVLAGKDQQGMVLRVNAMGFATCAAAGKCAGKPTNACEDGSACTADDCLPQLGSCVQTSHTGSCDSNQCSVGDACLGGACKASGKPKLWEKTVDGGSVPLYAESMIADGSGGLAVAFGATGGATSRVIGYTAAGDAAWEKQIPTTAAGKPLTLHAIDRANDGSYVLGGTWKEGAAPRQYCATLSASGGTLSPCPGSVDGQVYAVAARPDGGWLVAGTSSAFGNGAQALVGYYKLEAGNPSGVWSQYYGGAGDEVFHGIAAIAGGGAVGVGSSTTDSKGGTDGYVVQIGPDNAPQWGFKFGTDKDNWFKEVAVLPGGGYAIVGNTLGQTSLYDGWLVRIDSKGSLLWEKSYGGATTNEFTNGFAALPDGGFLLGGTVAPGPTAGVDPNSKPGDAWVVRTDAAGNVLWETKLAGGPAWDGIDRVVALANGTFAVAGYRGANGNFDAWLATVDPWGKGTCALAGACASIPFGSCKDGSGPCATPGCDPKKGCVTIDKVDGSACDDGKPCSVNDLCFGGLCEAGDDGLWDKAFGTAKSELLASVAARADGSILAAGRRNDTAAGNNVGWLLATGANGSQLWSQSVAATQWGGAASENVVFHEAIALADGTALAAGQHIPATGGTSSALLYRLDAAGAKVKVGTFNATGSNYFTGVVVADGTVWAAGRLDINGGDGWVQAVALDTLAADSQKLTVGSPGADWFNGIVAVPGGGTLAMGARTPAGSSVGWAVRVNAAGTALWSKEFAYSGAASFFDALPVGSTGFLLLGRVVTKATDVASSDMLIVRISAAGTKLWENNWSTAGYDAATAAVPNGDGWLVAGAASPGANGIDGILLNLNGQGGVVGTHAIGGSKGDEFYGMVQAGGALVLAGMTASSGAGGDDGWLVRVDPFGNATCTASGACLADAAKCDDKNPCTVDTCTAAAGCGNAKVADGTVCGSGQVCKAGVCGN